MTSPRAEEINFDGLVGLTHNYAGLSEGNLASARNKDSVSRPREAALQGLAKMNRLRALGLAQGVLPPQERPAIGWLRAALNLSGDDRAVFAQAWQISPRIARAACAASSMWAANAATVSPSADAGDGRLHVTVANLQTMLHRSLEAPMTERGLRRLMPEERQFVVHAALPANEALSDEGAANHMRLAAEPGAPGIEIFVYGRRAGDLRPGFPGRQTLEACGAISRAHRLDVDRTIFAQQSAKAIQAGAFHNDVVAVAYDSVLFHHEHAFDDRDALYAEIRVKAKGLFEPVFVEVKAADVSLEDAVSSYLFNSQLLRLPGDKALTLIAPREVRENNRTASVAQQLTAGPNAAIAHIEYVDVRESMRNGGGPACLRLRVVMTSAERAAAAQGFFLDDALSQTLSAWINKHYREEIAPDDLRDPNLAGETQAALDALTQILPLGSDFYPFQRA
ncbi:MAG: N-succinylarginine dihydrolase [Vitreimonas sp.]